MTEKILFMSTSTLAGNPRLVKEFEALKFDYKCFVICFQHLDWSEELSNEIKNRNPEVTFTLINRKERFLSTLFSKFIHKLAILLNSFVRNNICISGYAINDKTYQLKRLSKKIINRNDITKIISHTLGAFYPAYRIIKQGELQLDIEDFHPGELPYFNSKHETNNRILIMKKVLKRAEIVTYASPLIMQECLRILNNDKLIVDKSYLINNSFSQNEFQFRQVVGDKIKFVWFSQYISKGRGLEFILPVLYEFQNQIELHLIGNLYPEFNLEVLSKYKSMIKIHGPLSQKNLNFALADCDIGLALEVKSSDFNRQLCLTNKIWAYLQSGLFILASNTLAQENFISTHNNNGIISDLDELNLSENVKLIIQNINEIRRLKSERFQYSRQFSWEFEKIKFVQITSSVKVVN